MNQHILDVQVSVHNLLVKQRLAALSKLCNNQLGFSLCKSFVSVRQPQINQVNQRETIGKLLDDEVALGCAEELMDTDHVG